MSVSTERRRRLIKRMAGDKAERDAFVSEQLSPRLSMQIRALREARELTQQKLGEAAGMKQEVISKLEGADYNSYTLKTLVRLASAFDVALVVGFAPFSELIDWSVNLTPTKIAPPAFAEDEGLKEPPESSTDSTAQKMPHPGSQTCADRVDVVAPR